MAELTRIVCTVVSSLTGPDPIEVATDNRDRVAWDLYRSRTKLPTATDAPSLWATFIAWNALKRSGQISATFDEFTAATSAVEAEARPVDPTSPATEGA